MTGSIVITADCFGACRLSGHGQKRSTNWARCRRLDTLRFAIRFIPDMTFNIQGWIEISRWPDSGDEEPAWQGVLNLGSIVDVADSDSERLFGLSKSCVCGARVVDSIAAKRGLPSNPSPQVQDAIKRIRENEALHGEGESGGFTYVAWSEIRHYPIKESQLRSEWCIPFDFSRLLETRIPAQNIRFVVWFDW